MESLHLNTASLCSRPKLLKMKTVYFATLETRAEEAEPIITWLRKLKYEIRKKNEPRVGTDGPETVETG